MSSHEGLMPDLRLLTDRFRATQRLDDQRRDERPNLAGSPLWQKMLFVVGAPRSGTSWLQQLVAVHPRLATGCESHLFCEGLAGLWELDRVRKTQMGLRTWVTRPDFVRSVRAMADQIFGAALEAQPTTTHVLEKTPHHETDAAQRMAEVYPDATYVHIIRDGYSSAASMCDLWPDSEHGKSFANAAAMWRDGVMSAREALSGLNYLEFRYEDVVAEPAAHLAQIFGAAGLAYDDVLIAAAVELGRTPINVRPVDVRSGVDKWSGLDRKHAREVESSAGELLKELGYLRTERGARGLFSRR
jgi:LPS sulfotransferase NodH